LLTNKQFLLVEEESREEEPFEAFFVIVLPLLQHFRWSDLLLSNPSSQLFDDLSLFSGLSGLARSSRHMTSEKDVKDCDFP